MLWMEYSKYVFWREEDAAEIPSDTESYVNVDVTRIFSTCRRHRQPRQRRHRLQTQHRDSDQ
jgi:hypothetical protein